MSLNIAIVEDDSTYRELLCDVLESLSEVETVTAYESAEPFLNDVQTGTFHLALLDVNLPTMSGIDCVHALRATENGRAVPAVMLSSSTDQDHIEQAYDQGARGYLVKPRSLAELQDLLQDLVAMWARMAHPAAAMPA